MELFVAIQNAQCVALERGVRRIPDASLREWVERNEGAISTLVLWNLAFQVRPSHIRERCDDWSAVLRRKSGTGRRPGAPDKFRDGLRQRRGGIVLG